MVPHAERKLAAILAADVVGYSRMVESHEEDTIVALQSYRMIAEDLVTMHRGRVFGGAGDSLVAEFTSAVEAVRCALDIQQEVARRNAATDPERQMQFRIGVNLGDVVVDGDNLLGDAVNIAARLEALSPEGGFCVSQSIFDQIRGRIEIPLIDGGEHEVKNIARPVKVWEWHGAIAMDKDGAVTSAPRPLPDSPSVAVLAFVNMSGEAEQEYFSDGIAEDIITDLSKVSGLFVASRNSSFLYKGVAARPEDIGAELGVGHIVEGSVRKAGDRVRITAQLIDAATGGHVWADRYDRDLVDVFAVQDEITHRIVESLRVTLLPQEREAIERVPTENVDAYQSYLMGRQFFRRYSRSSWEIAKRMYQRAIELDPNYARAYAGVADCDSFLYLAYYRTELLDSILDATAKAIELDPDLAVAHASRGLGLFTVGRHEEAHAEFARALELDPNLYEGHYFLARSFVQEGKLEAALEHFTRAAEAMPDNFEPHSFVAQVAGALGKDELHDASRLRSLELAEQELAVRPDNARAAYLGAMALITMEEHDRAHEWLERSLSIDPDDFLTQYNVACAYSTLGELDKAIDLLEIALPKAHREIVRWVEHDSDLDPLRDDPRFQAVVESLATED